MVTRRNNTRHDNCIDEAPCHCASSLLEHDREGAGASVFRVESRVGVGHIQANHENGKDVEDDNPPKDIADHPRHSFRRVLGLTRCDGYRLSSATGFKKQKSKVSHCTKLLSAVRHAYYANEAVTKTEANPPIPPTKGESPW